MNTPKTIYYTGIVTLASINILGLIYISKTIFSNECNNTITEKNISRFTVVILWFLICWIILGAVIKEIWFKSVFI